MIMAYDERVLPTPPTKVSVGVLGTLLSGALYPIKAAPTLDPAEPVGSMLRIEYSEDLTAPQMAEAIDVINAHDATQYTDLGETFQFVEEINMSPASNTFVPIPGAMITVASGRRIAGGVIDVVCRVGPSGARAMSSMKITFDAQHEIGSALDVSPSYERRGVRINNFLVELDTSGDDIAVMMRRRGSLMVAVEVYMSYRLAVSV